MENVPPDSSVRSRMPFKPCPPARWRRSAPQPSSATTTQRSLLPAIGRPGERDLDVARFRMLVDIRKTFLDQPIRRQVQRLVESVEASLRVKAELRVRKPSPPLIDAVLDRGEKAQLIERNGPQTRDHLAHDAVQVIDGANDGIRCLDA